MAMSNEEWEELAQTIPSEDEPFIQKYISGRDALIAEEKKQRYGLSAPPPPPRPCFSHLNSPRPVSPLIPKPPR